MAVIQFAPKTPHPVAVAHNLAPDDSLLTAYDEGYGALAEIDVAATLLSDTFMGRSARHADSIHAEIFLVATRLYMPDEGARANRVAEAVTAVAAGIELETGQELTEIGTAQVILASLAARRREISACWRETHLPRFAGRTVLLQGVPREEGKSVAAQKSGFEAVTSRLSLARAVPSISILPSHLTCLKMQYWDASMT